MKKRLILSVVVAALLLVTAAAAGSGYLKAFFPTGISVFEKNVKTEPITGKIGDWEITVLASLTDDNGTYLNMSLKATGETAAKLSAMSSIHEVSEVIPDPFVYLEGEDEELESWPESDWDTDSPEWKTNPVISCSTQVIYENPENKPLVLKLGDFGSREPYPGSITVPVDNQIGGIERELNQRATTSGDPLDVNKEYSLEDRKRDIVVTKFSLTPLGLRLVYQDIEAPAEKVGNPDVWASPETCIFFEMADGKIYSFNHMLSQISHQDIDRDKRIVSYSAIMREPKELSTFKSIIFGTTAYPLDGGKPYQVKIDQKLMPFTVSCIEKNETATNLLGETYQRPVTWYPVKELCEKLGAGYSWDAEKKCATITYLGETLTLPVGSTTIVTPGDPTENTVQAALENGTLYASRDIIFALRICDGSMKEKVQVIYP